MSSGAEISASAIVSAPPCRDFPKDRLELLDYCKIKAKVCAEVGVLLGDYSAEILKRQPVELYLIDPWCTQDQNVYADINNHPEETETCCYEFVKDRFKSNHNVHIMKNFSHEAAREINRAFDFVYLDGNHSFNNVFFDLVSWSLKLKSGGWLCGHDYTNPPGGSYGGFVGVRMAVDAFCKVTGNEVAFVTKEGWGSFVIKVK